MIKTCVVLNGEIINIGEWDYQMQEFEVSPAVFDEEGNVIEDAVTEERPTNPLPEGAIIVELDIEFDENHGWYENTLENKRLKKISELYNAYLAEKLGDITSSLVAPDGTNYVFEYGEENQKDYTKIGVSFAIDDTLTESIIGSKSHGKFFITKEEYKILASEFKQHETSCYTKFADLRAQARNASEEELEQVMWS